MATPPRQFFCNDDIDEINRLLHAAYSAGHNPFWRNMPNSTRERYHELESRRCKLHCILDDAYNQREVRHFYPFLSTRNLEEMAKFNDPDIQEAVAIMRKKPATLIKSLIIDQLVSDERKAELQSIYQQLIGIETERQQIIAPCGQAITEAEIKIMHESVTQVATKIRPIESDLFAIAFTDCNERVQDSYRILGNRAFDHVVPWDEFIRLIKVHLWCRRILT